jgi:hypothetical protein
MAGHLDLYGTDGAMKSRLTDGTWHVVLDVADSAALEAAGYRYPEPFQVKAADGVTDIYGVMYKPFRRARGRVASVRGRW